MTDEYPPQGADTAPAFAGLIVAVIAIFAILFSIVWLTNSHYEQRETVTAPAPVPTAARY